MSDFSQPLIGVLPPGALTVWGSHSMMGPLANNTSFAYGATNVAWANANQAIYQAVIINQQITVTNMAVFVVTAAGNIDVGIYSERGTRLVSSGSTAMSGTSAMQSFDVTDTTLTPGLYWLACACSSTSASLLFSSTAAASNTAATCSTRGIMVQSSALPLPATATFAAIGANTVYPPFVTALTRTTF